METLLIKVIKNNDGSVSYSIDNNGIADTYDQKNEAHLLGEEVKERIVDFCLKD